MDISNKLYDSKNAVTSQSANILFVGSNNNILSMLSLVGPKWILRDMSCISQHRVILAVELYTPVVRDS